MAREHDPSNEIPSPSGPSAGASGTSGNSPVSVRRAVTMRGAAGDPGGALTPGGRPTAPSTSPSSPSPSPSSEGTGAGEATTGTDGAGAGTVVGAPAPSATAAPDATSAASPEPAESAESADSSESASSASAAETGTPPAVRTVGAVPDAPDAPAAAVAAAAAGSGGAGANSHAEGEPPGRRPKKPMLAAAAIAGAILIAVPFLVAGQDDREPERTRTQNAAGTVLGSERSAVPDTYTSESPTPSVKPSKKVKEKEKEKQAVPPAPQQTLTPSPSASEKAEVKVKPKPRPKPKPKGLTGAEKLRRWANGRSGVQNTVIKNASTSQCVDIADYGKGKPTDPVNQYPCNSTAADNQLWSLDIVRKSGGPQNAPVFLIRNSKDGLCLDVGYYDARPAGSKVSEFNCRPAGDNQLWWLDPRGDGTNWIRNVVSNDLCLRPTGGASAGNDARLEIAPCGVGDHWIV